MRPDFSILRKGTRENIKLYGGFFRGVFDNEPLWKYVICDTFKNKHITKIIL
jgi:hypothetical protein